MTKKRSFEQLGVKLSACAKLRFFAIIGMVGGGHQACSLFGLDGGAHMPITDEKALLNNYREFVEQSKVKGPRWAFGNEVLYRMCRESPLHEDPDVVVGKVWLIGRSYAAAIERRSGMT